MRIRLSVISALALSCFAFGPAVSAQQPIGVTTVQSKGGGEINSALLDNLAAGQNSSNGRIFVIARLGNRELVPALNQLRLQAARAYLVGTRGLKPTNIVFAAGDRVAGEGRLEFYLGSQLELVSLAQRDRNVVLSCCEDTVTPPPRHRRTRRSGH